MATKNKILLVLVLVIFIVAGVAFYLAFQFGKVRLGADTEYCQNTTSLGNMYGNSRWAAISQLQRINFVGASVMVNKKAAYYFGRVSKQIIAQGLNKSYRFSDVQTWNWRAKKPSGEGQSLHSYGIAIDINPAANPYVYTTSNRFQTNIPKAVIRIFKANGFFWGGNWVSFKDPMHFEWYGGEIKGTVRSMGGRRVGEVKVYLENDLIGKFKDNYDVTLPEGRHRLVFRTNGYGDETFAVNLKCNDVKTINIKLTPTVSGPPGLISGSIAYPPRVNLKSPADIYLDGAFAVRSDENGYYTIPAVAAGYVHQVEARLFPLYRGATFIKIKPGKTAVADMIILK